ncbi:Fanconi anemia group M protein [Sesbania bispinosa]|nr:Fanconi anemia group M protein [Sesbania bispinosa]
MMAQRQGMKGNGSPIGTMMELDEFVGGCTVEVAERRQWLAMVMVVFWPGNNANGSVMWQHNELQWWAIEVGWKCNHDRSFFEDKMTMIEGMRDEQRARCSR